MLSGFPTIVCLGISFPLDEVLLLFPAPMGSFSQDLLHFILLVPIDQVRWWFWEVWSMLRRLLIG
jgi:hypothetical protein